MVSIIVPVYNAEKYIKRCLDSVCGQTYTDLEIILINDGSNDGSLVVLQTYAASDDRIRVISQENKGVAAARNTGLRNVNGDFILYVDSDDWIEPDMIERMMNLSVKGDIVFCGNDNAESEMQSKRFNNPEIEIWDNDKQLLEFMKHKRMTGMLWNKLIKTSLTEGIQFNENTGYGEDAEFLWQVLKRSQKMVVTNEILYHHVDNDLSISSLSFSDRKYSSIPMWENINKEVEREYPQLVELARVCLMCATVYGMYEARMCRYTNTCQIKHMRKITRKNIGVFIKSSNVSKKFKLYALAVCMGF
jgi:glycosyltransferase involved in cell wall biosynthesis